MLESVIVLCILVTLAIGVTWPVRLIKYKRKKVRNGVLISSIIITVVVLILLTYFFSKSRNLQLFGNIISHIETEDKVIALTFDDGPSGSYTKEILDILEAYGVKSTFYLNGAGIQTNMNDTKMIIDAGHEIGNHSYSHNRMMLMSYKKISTEIESTDQMIIQAGYDGPITIRSPYCKKLLFLPLYLELNQRINVTFSIEPQTYYSTAEDMINYIKEETKSGDIILLHVLNEANESAREALADMLDYLISEGYQFLTVSELLEYDH
ncbi:MAG: polysaccharide deacetylase family protein [Vallitaleaceae bacterium]|jgi:peptidoglycan/xylan/chitin deacetylase (PgdA/CDA1 family)|nr:polysaccharide deacetylase family protein [Vallitaleaceae bacterium]